MTRRGKRGDEEGSEVTREGSEVTRTRRGDEER